MTDTITIHRTYKYRLYSSKDNRLLCHRVNIAGFIWNHCLGLQKRYYRRFKKYIPLNRMQAHIAYLRRKTTKYCFWKELGSQAVQNIIKRLDNAYQRFFKKKAGFPHFKKVKKYKSFTLKQAGWKLLPDMKPVIPKPGGKGFKRGVGVIEICGRIYKFIKHRPLNGKVKTVTIKRDKLGHLWVCFSVIEQFTPEDEISTGQSGGFDFGLRTFLTDEQGRAWMSPLFFYQGQHQIKRLHRSLSQKKEGSLNKERARYALACAYAHMANKRLDFHFKLAHALCDEYDYIFLEKLNVKAMQKRWGKKVSDLAFARFVTILKLVAEKRGVIVHQIGRFESTTAKCSVCNHKCKLDLRERTFRCKKCGLVLDRDHNAAINIHNVGASTFGLGLVRHS